MALRPAPQSSNVDSAAIAAAVTAAVPDVADIEAASEAGATTAITTAALATAASVSAVQTDVDTLLARFPDLLVAEETSVAAAGSAEVVAASPGQQIAVYGWDVGAENASGGGTLGFFSGDPMGAGTPVRSGAFGTGGQWRQEPVQDQVVFSTIAGEPLYLANDGVDPVTGRVYYRLVTP